MKTKKTNKIAKIKTFLSKHKTTIFATLLLMAMMCVGTAFAEESSEIEGGQEAEELWQTFSNLISKWVTRIGLVIMFVGGVMFGIGFKENDASQKTNGLQTLGAGAIVAALGGMAYMFFK